MHKRDIYKVKFPFTSLYFFFFTIENYINNTQHSARAPHIILGIAHTKVGCVFFFEKKGIMILIFFGIAVILFIIGSIVGTIYLVDVNKK